MMKSTIRKAFVMSVFSRRKDEYERRHDPIWEELRDVLKAHGVSNYSIFHLPPGNCFLATLNRKRRALGGDFPDGCLRALVAAHERHHAQP